MKLRCSRVATVCAVAFFSVSLTSAGCGGDSDERVRSDLTPDTEEIERSSGLEIAPPARSASKTATDETGAISFEIPTTWNGRLENDVDEGGATIGRSIVASPDPRGYNSSFGVPGILIFASLVRGQQAAAEADPGQEIQRLFRLYAQGDPSSICGLEQYDTVIAPDGEDVYSQLLADLAETGILTQYPNCDKDKADFLRFAFLTKDGIFVYGEATAPTTEELADVNRALETLTLDGSRLPSGTGTPEATTTETTETETTETTETESETTTESTTETTAP